MTSVQPIMETDPQVGIIERFKRPFAALAVAGSILGAAACAGEEAPEPQAFGTETTATYAPATTVPETTTTEPEPEVWTTGRFEAYTGNDYYYKFFYRMYEPEFEVTPSDNDPEAVDLKVTVDGEVQIYNTLEDRPLPTSGALRVSTLDFDCNATPDMQAVTASPTAELQKPAGTMNATPLCSTAHYVLNPAEGEDFHDHYPEVPADGEVRVNVQATNYYRSIDQEHVDAYKELLSVDPDEVAVSDIGSGKSDFLYSRCGAVPVIAMINSTGRADPLRFWLEDYVESDPSSGFCTADIPLS